MSTTVSLTFTTHCCCPYTDQWMGRNMHTSSSKKGTVHEWVSCLAIIDVNNSFTHIRTFCCCSYTDLWIRRGMRISSGEKNAQFKESSSIKVHKWVGCLAIVDVNNSFTHIHNPLLLLIHRSMDGKGHTQAPVKKSQFKESRSVKVNEWVSCLAVVDVNNSSLTFTTLCCWSYTD